MRADYLAYLRTDVQPVMKKAKAAGKIAGYQVSTRGAGAALGEMTTTTYYSKFADMDAGSPLIQGAGPSAAAPITPRGAAVATGLQVIVGRRVADLSF
jgi:hypothetical protein